MTDPRPVYLDCAATSPPEPAVVDLMLRYLTSDFGNSGSYLHEYGTAARKAVERARDQIAAALQARRSEIVFTSGATEANNLVILNAANSAPLGHIVTTAIEHPAVLEPLRALEARGVEVTNVSPTKSGWVEAERVLAAVRPDTRLVTVMHVNNETGVIQPVEEVADGLNESSAWLHVDGAQGFGKLPLRHARIDSMAISAHKIGGPQGVGALMVRRRVRSRVAPLMFGGGQEGGLRPGTLPVALIAGFGLAVELAMKEMAPRRALAEQFQKQVIAGLLPANFAINGSLERHSPYILNVSFAGLDSQQVTEAWSSLVAVSNGSACTSQHAHCSHVLQAMGVSDARAAGAIRLSWCLQTALPDFAAMVKALEALPRDADD